MAKYYAVRNGRNTGIYDNWSYCEKQVKGFENAEYKSFKTKKEAEDYLNNIKNDGNISLKDGLVAYIDGSYNDKNKEYGSGIYFVKDNQEHFYYFKGNDVRFVKNRNVAGELMAAIWIMKYCIDKNINKLHLFYDYAGIEKWAIGEWKTNKELTKLYKQFYDSIKDKLEVNFFKVEAHSGDEKNDIADNLAKKSLQENKIENLLT